MSMTSEQKLVWDFSQQGLSQTEIAEQLGVSRNAVKKRIARAKKWHNASDGHRAALEATGLDVERAKHGWRIVQHKDGSRDSVFWTAEDTESESLIERVRDALCDIEPAAPVAAPVYADDDLCTVYPIADRHNGMLAWGKETGEHYNSKIATARLTEWIGRCIDSSPASKTAVILDVGDGEHVNDQTNVTPKSKHTLDVDSRVFMTLETSVHSLCTAVDLALAKHERVIMRILPGNHNPTLYLAVMFAIAERYRAEPRVEVQKVPGEFWVMQFGQCMLAAHHGDKAKPERIVMFLADEYAEMWGQTRHRVLYTGHLHHLKSADIGGVTWEQLRAVTARDAHAIANAYVARAQLQGVTFHRDRGEIQRVKVGL